MRSPRFALHDNPGHVENQRRLTVTEQMLDESGLSGLRPVIAFEPATREQLERVHPSSYLEALEQFVRHGSSIGADTYVGPQSFEVAVEAAGAAVAAVDAVLDGRAGAAFALVRPPGHHATPTEAMGFCLINHIAVAAAHGLARGLERVAIVDWDVHHGNGTQDIFYDSPQVLFCSIHQYPFYPGTGAAQERGVGAGEGYTLNFPLRAGHGDQDYIRLMRERIVPAIREYDPQLVLISAGYDAYFNDPLGGMNLTESGYAELTRLLADVADSHAEGRIVAVLEGGYDPAGLARSVAATLMTLDGEGAAQYSDNDDSMIDDSPGPQQATEQRREV